MRIVRTGHPVVPCVTEAYMSVFDTFTKRRKQQARKAAPDVFQYDNLPDHFRIQVVRIIDRAFGPYIKGDGWVGRSDYPSVALWKSTHEILMDEVEGFALTAANNVRERVVKFMLSA